MDIDILTHLPEENIILDIKEKTKRKVISWMIEHLVRIGKVKEENKKEIIKTIIQREEIGSTAIGGGVALPHARLGCIDSIILELAIFKEGVDFSSLDGELVNIVFLLLSHQKESGFHLKMLALLAKLLRDRYFVQQLKNAKTSQEVISLIARQQRTIQ